MSRTSLISSALVGIVFLSACAEPPVASIDAAGQAQTAAVAAGAEEYAPAAMARVSICRMALAPPSRKRSS